MSAPAAPSPRRPYSDAMWNTSISEAIQSGSFTQYCTDKNMPYSITSTRSTNSIQTKRIGHLEVSVGTLDMLVLIQVI